MEVGLAAAQLGVAVADWVISPLAERVVDRALSYLGSCSSDDFKYLERDTKLVKGIIQAADARLHGDMLEPWMKELKSSYSQAEDILDIIDYHRIESRVASQKHDKSTSTASPSPFKKRKTSSPSDRGEDSNIPGKSKRKLKEALDNIRNLISEGKRLLSELNLQAGCDNLNNTTSGTLSRALIPTTSAPPAVVFGRDGERDEIIGYLHGSPAAGRCYTVIGIHGIAGSGKTTLVQHVLKKESQEEHFDAIMWIHVTQTFSVVNVLNEMLTIASGVQSQLTNADLLQKKLKKQLKSKRFILVLDDVWYKKGVTEQKLQLILDSLENGGIGSKILVTSRTKDVAEAFPLCAKCHLISVIEEQEYIKMFLHYALYGTTLTDKASREYHSIGRRIAKKLGGSPLAATTVAAQLQLRKGDVGYWINVMKSDLWQDTKGALFWSYQQLEENVKQCFKYCSIFPRRCELEQDELVRLWMAEGFVETSSDEEDMEKVANDYFHVLLSSSFIQSKRKTSDMEYFTIHDLLHDLAEDVAGNDCFRVEEGMVGQIPPDVRHIFLESSDPGVFAQIVNLKALHTLIMPSSEGLAQITVEQFESLLSNQQKLRVLHVRLTPTFLTNLQLPNCIGELKHLRCIRFWSPIRQITLPLEFVKLYHLQMFFAFYGTILKCSNNKEMTNLVNLRYIVCSDMDFPNIGRLTSLRTMRVFTVKKAKGYEIYQLECLDNLCGTLFIEALENVKSKEEALQAKLHKKINLSNLTLQWNTGSDFDSTSGDKETEVLEALCPPFLIKSLSIRGYRGRTYPSWLLEEDGGLDNLQMLELTSCDTLPKNLDGCLNLHTLLIHGCGWYSLPENLEHLKSLRSLYIIRSINIQSLPELPESLELLEIRQCPKLKESYEKGGSIWDNLVQQKTTIKFS